MRLRHWRTIAIALGVGALAGREVRAGDRDDEIERSPRAPSDRILLHWGTAALSDRQSVRPVESGAASQRAVFRDRALVELAPRVALGVAASPSGNQPVVDPELALSFEVVRRRATSLAFATGYERQSPNLVPAFVTRIDLVRRFHASTFFARVALGLGAGGERYGAARAAFVVPLGRSLAGFDTNVRLDLERDHDEPAGEAAWEILAGPVLARPLGPFVVSASAGLTAFRRRLVDTRRIGGQAMVAVTLPIEAASATASSSTGRPRRQGR